ncbi:MAG TPA: hypothetical protein VEI01_16650 [Terriglobales bacterium]|nr:hypothetical protein [Terriglobales bacterium]
MKRSVTRVVLSCALLGTLVGVVGLALRSGPLRFGGHSVTLNWKAPAPIHGRGIIGYNVYRSTKLGGPYEVIALRVIHPTYTDKDVDSGKTYYYVITSIDQAGRESKHSEEVRATVP